MVMEEAIKDKTAQMQKEMEEANGMPTQQIVDKKCYKCDDESDSDFNSDGDDAIL